ncbi:MAG: LysR substrate-binding domain-containing protein, partial [Polaromonas sp.]|nr:LysR substrate-binding domain-containing protein [Polaromonas sp.]
MAASTVMAEYLLVPSLKGLKQRHPRVCVELKVEDRLVDMVRDGVDIAIRSGMHTNENTVMRQIGPHGRRLYATPGYLAAHGTPGHPDDLGGHRLISNSGATALNRWPFIIDGQP